MTSRIILTNLLGKLRFSFVFWGTDEKIDTTLMPEW